MLQTDIIRGWLQHKCDLEPTQGNYWPIRHDLAVNDGIAMKGKWVIIPFFITEADTRPTMQELHGDGKDVASCKRLSILDQHECWYRVCVQAILHKGVLTNTTQGKGITLWNTMHVVSADIFMVNVKPLLCIVDYHSKFWIVKKINSLSADDLVQTTKMILHNMGSERKLFSDVDTNSTSKTFTDFLQEDGYSANNTSSPHHHQSNGHVESFIKFIKCTIKNTLLLIGTYI